jgi:hypothetical protein
LAITIISSSLGNSDALIELPRMHGVCLSFKREQLRAVPPAARIQEI